MFLQEKDNLELAEATYVWAGEGIEDRILRKYGKLPPTAPAPPVTKANPGKQKQH